MDDSRSTQKKPKMRGFTRRAKPRKKANDEEELSQCKKKDAPRRVAKEDEPSVTPQHKKKVDEDAPSVMLPPDKKKKNKVLEEEPSSLMQKKKNKSAVEEENSILQQPDKKKGKSKPGSKNSKVASVAPEVEESIAQFMKHAIDNNVDKLREEFNVVSEAAIGPHAKCCANKDRSRVPDVPCLDETRIVVEAKPNESDFYHANKIVLDKAERDFIAAQAPKENGFEDFWKIVFQNSSPAIILLCAFYEDGQQKCEEFWPLENGAYKYYGNMFINNKKVEHVEQYTIYTLEVLPEGCSNSLVTRLVHCSTWPDNLVAPSGRMVLRIIKWLKTLEAGTATVVSSSGIGRPGTYIAIDTAVARLVKGVETNIRDIVLDIRRQRACAVANELQYMFIYSTVLDYIRAKLPKYNSAVSKFFTAIRSASNN